MQHIPPGYLLMTITFLMRPDNLCARSFNFRAYWVREKHLCISKFNRP